MAKWNFDVQVEFDTGQAPNYTIWDGRFLVVTMNDSTRLYPYEVFDRSHMSDACMVQCVPGDPIKNEYFTKIDTYLTIDEGGYWITPYVNDYFITNAQQFTSIKRVNFIDGLIETIECPLNEDGQMTMNSNLIECNGMLWCVYSRFAGDYLMTYKLDERKWYQILIPSREQPDTLRYIAHDKNGHVLVTNANDGSITVYNVDGSFHSTVDLYDDGNNKDPEFIWVGEDKSVYVWSYGGMLSSVNTDTFAVTHFATDPGGPSFYGFDVSDTYRWTPTTRTDLSTGRTIASEEKVVGETTLPAGYNCPEAVRVVCIPEITKPVWNGSAFVDKTYNQQVIYQTTTGITAVPELEFYQTNFFNCKGFGMISSGPYNYTGA